ncbi:MAG: YdjY domain-containing protein [Planctomycetota bacterium]
MLQRLPILFALAVGALPGSATRAPASGQSDAVDPTAPVDSDAYQRFLKRLAEEDIRFDRKAGRIEMTAVVLRDHQSPEFPIEFMLVGQGGFTHETLFLCRVTPSLLNACFLALGLTPGHTVRFVPRDPPPPADDVIAGKISAYKVVPPQGPLIYTYVRMEQEVEQPDGKKQLTKKTVPIEDLLVDLRSDQPPPFKGLVYIGSRFSRSFFRGELKEVYVADFEGNLIATYLRGDGNTLLEWNASEDRDDILDVNLKTVPKRETKVDIIFSVSPLPDVRKPDVVAPPVATQLPLDELRAKTTNATLKGATQEALKSFAGQSFAQVAKRLAIEPEAKLRALAAAILGASRSPGAVKSLIDAFHAETDAAVRSAVIAALFEIQSYDVVKSVADELQVGSDSVKKEAHALLKQISGADLPADIGKWQIWLNENINRFR